VTARRLLVIAAGLGAAGFALLHLAGGRACVEVLSGTPAASHEALVLGLLYVVAWFGFVLVIPIVLLALGLDAAWGKMRSAWRASRRP
jgi:hypothetical protein